MRVSLIVLEILIALGILAISLIRLEKMARPIIFLRPAGAK